MEDNRRRCTDRRDAEVAAIVAATGMGELQAYRHWQGRQYVREAFRGARRA